MQTAMILTYILLSYVCSDVFLKFTPQKINSLSVVSVLKVYKILTAIYCFVNEAHRTIYSVISFSLISVQNFLIFVGAFIKSKVVEVFQFLLGTKNSATHDGLKLLSKNLILILIKCGTSRF